MVTLVYHSQILDRDFEDIKFLSALWSVITLTCTAPSTIEALIVTELALKGVSASLLSFFLPQLAGWCLCVLCFSHSSPFSTYLALPYQ